MAKTADDTVVRPGSWKKGTGNFVLSFGIYLELRNEMGNCRNSIIFYFLYIVQCLFIIQIEKVKIFQRR